MDSSSVFSSGSFDIIRGSRRWLIIAGQENKAFAAQLYLLYFTFSRQVCLILSFSSPRPCMENVENGFNMQKEVNLRSQKVKESRYLYFSNATVTLNTSIYSTVNGGYGFGGCFPWYRGRDYRQLVPRGQAPPVIYITINIYKKIKSSPAKIIWLTRTLFFGFMVRFVWGLVSVHPPTIYL